MQSLHESAFYAMAFVQPQFHEGIVPSRLLESLSEGMSMAAATVARLNPSTLLTTTRGRRERLGYRNLPAITPN